MAVTADYRLSVDFNGDADFLVSTTPADAWAAALFLAVASYGVPDPYEDVSSDWRQEPLTFVGRGRDQAREYSPPQAGTMEFSLANDDGRYSSANPASPIAGLVLPGRLVDFRASYAGVDYPLFRGYLDVPTELPYMTRQEVHLSALDGLARLKAAKVSTAMYTGIRTDQAIGHVLDAAGWSATARTLDTGRTTLARWWVDQVDAFTAIRDLTQTEGVGALFYVDAEGDLVFESRHYRLLNSRSTTSQGTLRGAGAEPVYGSDFEYEPGLKGVVNACTVPVRSYASTGGATVWTASGLPLTLGPSEVRTLTVSTSADGFSGATVSITPGTVGTSLDRTSGKTATLTLTAPAGGATVTALSVTGTTWAISSTQVGHTIDASTSQATYGVRAFPDEFVPKWVPTTIEAVDFCNAVVGRYKDPRPQVRISLTNGAEERLIQALGREISDRVHVVENSLAFVDDDFFVETITHEVSSGRNHKTKLSCERAVDQTFWILGDPTYGLLGDTSVLGY